MQANEKQGKILIVDDHPATRKLLQDILAEHLVLSTDNGHEALNILKDHPDIDLVLLDVVMPNMNGYEVCRQIKENPATKNIPVIFLTIMAEEQNEALGFSVGVTDYMIKPVSRVRLQARVSNQLQLKRQQELLNQKNGELQNALDQIKVLSGILPICSFCKQIRNDRGSWQKVEEYLREHSDAKFTHSVCPECMKEHYSGLENT